MKDLQMDGKKAASKVATRVLNSVYRMALKAVDWKVAMLVVLTVAS